MIRRLGDASGSKGGGRVSVWPAQEQRCTGEECVASFKKDIVKFAASSWMMGVVIVKALRSGAAGKQAVSCNRSAARFTSSEIRKNRSSSQRTAVLASHLDKVGPRFTIKAHGRCHRHNIKEWHIKTVYWLNISCKTRISSNPP